MNSKEQLAEDFAKKYRNTSNIYHNNYEIYLAGFSAKEEIIEETLDTLTQLLENMSKLPLTEQLFKSRDFDRLNTKIELLKSLL